MTEVLVVQDPQTTVVIVEEDSGVVMVEQTTIEVVEIEGSIIVVESPPSVEVVQLTPDVVVVEQEPVTEVIEIGIAGPQGPPGAPGAAGAAPQAYVHDQSVPSSTWTITHGLGYYPNVTVIDTLGRVVWGEISYPSLATVVAVFTAGFSGKAYLS